MCWMCGAFRPCDGPDEFKNGKNYEYVVDGVTYDANECADWEALDHFPAWDEVDDEGEPFFVIISCSDEDVTAIQNVLPEKQIFRRK